MLRLLFALRLRLTTAAVTVLWLAVGCGSATPSGGAPAATDAAKAADTGGTDSTAATDAAPADSDTGDAAAVVDAKVDAAADTAVDTGAADAGADTAADAVASSPIPLAELASVTAAAICAANFATCAPQDKMPFATQAGCVAAQTATDSAVFAKLAALVAAGKLFYDPAAAGSCLALAAELCDELDFVDGPPVCQIVFKGKAAKGAACTFNVECASNYCFNLASCPGACKNRVALNAACGEDDKCVAGAVCFGGLCVADTPKDAGAACDPVQCKPGLYCSSKEKCTPLIKLGAACDIVGSCVAGAQCIDDGAGGACKPMPKKGEPCAPDPFADASTQCATGLVCFNDGGDSGTCEPKVPIGGACVNSTQCGGWDVHCLGAAGKANCQLLSAKGGPCQPAKIELGEWSGCLEPWTCSGGVCIDVPVLGQKCADDLLKSCADDFMCDLVTNKCIAVPGLGEKCYGLCKTGFECDLAKTPNVCKAAVCQ